MKRTPTKPTLFTRTEEGLVVDILHTLPPTPLDSSARSLEQPKPTIIRWILNPCSSKHIESILLPGQPTDHPPFFSSLTEVVFTTPIAPLEMSFRDQEAQG